MKINHQILSIPPYISTSWKNVAAISLDTRVEGPVLVIQLQQGHSIEIPHLDGPIMELIFAAYEKHLESPQTTLPTETSQTPSLFGGGSTSFAFPFPIDASQIDNFPGLLQHNPEQSDAEDLPEEILDKIASVSKMLGVKDLQTLPQPEPHCNCMHCQIARAIHHALDASSTPELEVVPEEVVSDEELTFRMWDVEQMGEKLYSVKDPDLKESFHVYLGDPIGCTCGEKNCEHIRAVLNS